MEDKKEKDLEEKQKCSCNDSTNEDTCCCKENECECSKDKKKRKKHKDQDNIEALQEELAKKDELIKELDAKIKYHQAELINYRKRKEEEVENRLKYANQDLISELIILLDNFERAIKLDDNDLTDELSKFLKGFKMMYASFDEVLKKYGLTEIEAEHKEYDPKVMEALMTDSDPNFKDEEVLEVLLKGYKLKDRVIRPVAVRVNKLENINNDDKGEDENE